MQVEQKLSEKKEKGIFSLLKPVCWQQGGIKVGLCGSEMKSCFITAIVISLLFDTELLKSSYVHLKKKIKDNGDTYLNVVGFIFVKYFRNFRKGKVQNVNIF